MAMQGRRLRYGLIAAAVLVSFAFLNNTNLFVSSPTQKLTLLAHRGVAQRFDTMGLTAETCTASRMIPSGHGFIENTIPSMRAAFDAGADIVELDVQPTTDGQFAVFHDWTLDCRTDGKGRTRDHDMEALRKLDVGYGYTADGGKTFPLRGSGVGLMPSLGDVLQAFPDRRFLIHVKSNDVDEGVRLAAFLAAVPARERARLAVYGGGLWQGNDAVETVKRLMPDVRVMSGAILRRCLTEYAAYGWTGLMPEACHGTLILLPINIAPWLWGWPDRLLERFARVGTQVFVVGPFGGEGFSTGINTAQELARLPQAYRGGVWTDEIGLVARTLRGRSSP